jgi:hypothetical protein
MNNDYMNFVKKIKANKGKRKYPSYHPGTGKVRQNRHLLRGIYRGVRGVYMEMTNYFSFFYCPSDLTGYSFKYFLIHR